MAEYKGEGEGIKGGAFVLGGQRTALDREETTWPVGKWQFVEVKGKPCVGMRCLVLIGQVN